MPITSLMRKVRFTTEENLEAVLLPVRTDALTLAPGVRIEVEIGGRWVWIEGESQRVGGHWVACEVVADTSRDLLVKLL